VEIQSEDIPGWLVASDGPFTVALDITLTEELLLEGTAREFVNRIQNLRKSKGLEVTDRISLVISSDPAWDDALTAHRDYLCGETLAQDLLLSGNPQEDEIEVNGTTGSLTIQVIR
jgi:isoleucyl-tRNA synthetase